DQTDAVDLPHLDAAYALWRYCEVSARYIFGTLLGDPLADELCRILQQMGTDGITRTEISNTLGRNYKSTTIGLALERLHREGLARYTVEKTAGRPVERWFIRQRSDALNEKSPPCEEHADLNSFHSLLRHTPNGVTETCAHERTGEQAGQSICLDCGE